MRPSIDAPFTEVTGINDRIDLAAVEARGAPRINEGWMRAGVTMVDPATTYIDADVGPIGKDVWLGPNVSLRGKTTIGDDMRIDQRLGDHRRHDRATTRTSSRTRSSARARSARACRSARSRTCRPGSQIDEDVHLGNFVETKKTHMMAGAKANHLAYLGDASVGQKANVGAGVITCNYDGVGKYKTTIESGAFIGSDSQLVAPVTIGRDSYVGAGTTVTKDVPRGALALTRVKQVNVEGWADRFREAQAKHRTGK